jgi:sugar lactone lactonase YvrE
MKKEKVMLNEKKLCPADVYMSGKKFSALVLLSAFSLMVWQSTAAWAANLDTTADRVLGQTNFTNILVNQGGPAAAGTLNNPFGVAVDKRNGRIYVADFSNNRVLSWPNAKTFADGASADKVFGQPNFTATTANNGGVGAASLSGPTGVAVDGRGNLYVCDYNNNRVLAYDDPTVNDTTADLVFGQPNFTGNTANNGGIGAGTLFQPFHAKLDAADNLYVADTGNNRVLEYNTPYNSGTTADRVFGQPNFTGNVPNNGGIGAGTLDTPADIAIDATGNVYIADFGNNRVLEYDAPLTGDTVADRVFGQVNFTNNLANQGGLPSASTLSNPVSVDLDSAGNLYVVDRANNRVLEYDTPATSNVVADRVFGQVNFTAVLPNQGGAASAGTLSNPNSAALDNDNNLYLADSANNRVLGFDLPVANAVPAITALFPGICAAGGADFILSVDGTGFVSASVVRWNGVDLATTYVASTRLSAAVPAANAAAAGSAFITVFNPTPGGGLSTFKNFTIYERQPLDAVADRVLGQPDFASNTANNGGVGPRSLSGVNDAVVDPSSGRLWAADRFNNRVLSWPSAADFTNGMPADFVVGQPDLFSNVANNGGVSAKSLSTPTGVAVDAAGNLYVADAGNNRVLIYKTPLTTATADFVIGQPDFTGNTANNGGLSASSLSWPFGVALDSAGNLYVSDQTNNRVLEYNTPLTADLVADRVFGQPNFTGNTANNGGISASGLNTPALIAVDSAGSLYISDFFNNRVLEYNFPLTTDTVADRVFGQSGNFTTNTANLGGLSASSLFSPVGVCVDSAGNVYIVDSGNNRVLEYDTPATNDTVADRVFGQGGSFISGTANNGGVSPNSLANPRNAFVTTNGNLYLADLGNNRLLVFDHPLNAAPVTVGSEPLTATPASPGIGETTTFEFNVTDIDGDLLSIAWDFGDGTTGTGTSPTHSFAAAGAFTVTATATDPFGASVSASLVVTVRTTLIGASTDSDSDGDGFADSFEIAVGTNPNDAASTPFDGAPASTPTALDVGKIAVKLNFASAGKDAIGVAGTLAVPASFNPNGAKVYVNVGEVITVFTLNAKGAGTSSLGGFRMNIKAKKGVVAAQTSKFRLLLRGNFAAALAVSSGLTNDNASKVPKTVVVTILFDNAALQKDQTVSYSAKAGKSGLAK